MEKEETFLLEAGNEAGMQFSTFGTHTHHPLTHSLRPFHFFHGQRGLSRVLIFIPVDCG